MRRRTQRDKITTCLAVGARNVCAVTLHNVYYIQQLGAMNYASNNLQSNRRTLLLQHHLLFAWILMIHELGRKERKIFTDEILSIAFIPLPETIFFFAKARKANMMFLRRWAAEPLKAPAKLFLRNDDESFNAKLFDLKLIENTTLMSSFCSLFFAPHFFISRQQKSYCLRRSAGGKKRLLLIDIIKEMFMDVFRRRNMMYS